MRTRCLSLEGGTSFQYPSPLPFQLVLASLRNPRFIPLQLGIPSHQLHVMTDASGVGWGLVSPLPCSLEFDASLRQADIALVGLLTILGLPFVPLHSNVLVLTDSLESLRVLR